MKKPLIWVLGLIFLVSLIFLNWPLIKAGIAGSTLDQSYEAVTGSSSIVIGNYGNRKQSFKPSKNTLTSLDVYLKNRQVGSWITLELIDDTTGAVIKTETHQLTAPSGDTWETFAFISPYVSVVPERTYWIKLTVSDSATQWAYNYDGYGRGVWGLNPAYDGLFRVYGMNVSSPSTTTTTLPSTTTTTLAQAEKLKPPELLYVMKNEEKIKPPIEDILEVNEKDTLKVYGRSLAQTKVYLFVGDQAEYSSQADSSGEWKIKIDLNDLEEGNIYKVKAQAQNEQGETSEKVDFFMMKKVKAPEVSSEVKKFPWWLVILGGLVVVIGGGLGYFIWQKKRAEKASLKNQKEETSLENPEK